MSSAFSPLTIILTQYKLIGSNFIDWKRNLDIILTAEDHTYVLTTPYPEEPTVGATAAARHEFENGRSRMEWLVAICLPLWPAYCNINSNRMNPPVLS